MNCVDNIKRELKYKDEIKRKWWIHSPKIEIVQIKWDGPKWKNASNSMGQREYIDILLAK